jgi:hypothetical protein
MLSIGACLVDDITKSFYLELKPINDAFTQEALAICPFSLDTLKREGTPPFIAMRRFAQWIGWLHYRASRLILRNCSVIESYPGRIVKLSKPRGTMLVIYCAIGRIDLRIILGTTNNSHSQRKNNFIRDCLE